MERLKIETRKDYKEAKSYGFEPLVDDRFEMAHSLRVEVQKEVFGDGHTPAENEKFYRWVWDHKPHICEECMKPLNGYSATYVSHILSRGAYPEMAHDPRNCNVLCFHHHAQWENGNRETMRINRSNQNLISKLKSDYGTWNR